MNELEDIWEFLPSADDAPSTARAAEEEAVHVRFPSEWGRRLDDPARREVMTAVEEDTGTVFAGDEDGDSFVRDDERLLDVEELLEAQHYAFPSLTDVS
jgi:hypothetical protein